MKTWDRKRHRLPDLSFRTEPFRRPLLLCQMRSTDIGAECRCRNISSLPYEHSFPVNGLSCGIWGNMYSRCLLFSIISHFLFFDHTFLR